MADLPLLESIIADAMGDAPVAQILRKLKVLASRVGAEPLLSWVNKETYGYGRGLAVPKYRGPFLGMPLANFEGPMVSVKNHPITRAILPVEMQDGECFMITIYQSIAEVQNLMKGNDGTRFGWPGDAILLYNMLIRQGKGDVDPKLVCMSVQIPIPDYIFEGVLDAVRNKALDLVLELESTVPEAGQVNAPEATRSEAREVINQFIFKDANLGQSNNAFGSTAVEQRNTARGGTP